MTLPLAACFEKSRPAGGQLFGLMPRLSFTAGVAHTGSCLLHIFWRRL